MKKYRFCLWIEGEGEDADGAFEDALDKLMLGDDPVCPPEHKRDENREHWEGLVLDGHNVSIDLEGET